MAALHPITKWLTLMFLLDSVLWLNSWLQKVKCPFACMKGWKMCMGMQQWMSALLDDGFVAVKKLKDFKDEEAVKTSVRQWLRRQDLAFTGLEYMPLLKAGPKWWKWTEIIMKSDKLIVNVVVFKLCNCIWVFLKIKGENNRRHYLLTDPRTLPFSQVAQERIQNIKKAQAKIEINLD